jgi:hypothetical protein
MRNPVIQAVDAAAAEFRQAWNGGAETVLRMVQAALRGGLSPAQVADALATEDFRGLFESLGFQGDLAKMQEAFGTVLSRMAGRGQLSEATLQGITNTFADSFLAQANAYPDRLKELTVRTLLSGGGVTELRAAIAAELPERYADTLANTALNTYSRSVEAVMAEQDPPDALYVYEGPSDDRTRDECLAMIAAGELTRAEVEAQFPGAFVDGGGFNCRHSWVPIAAAAR